MKLIGRTIFFGLMLAPAGSPAELAVGGQVVRGYGEVDGTGDGYGIVDLTLWNADNLGDIKLKWASCVRLTC